jgi:hypothetical protein
LLNFGSNGEEVYPHAWFNIQSVEIFCFCANISQKSNVTGEERSLSTADIATYEYSWSRMHQYPIKFLFNI